MTHDELLKKIKTQEEYWTNLVHFTNPEFYENTVDQRNAWQALKAIVQLHTPGEMQGTCKACEFNDFFHCPTIKAIDKALA
jgi:hypothetical protein